MPDPIFERYKEALRAGHVAALRGRPDDALQHYRLAASIAPDRALPHVGMADVLLRLGRHDEALTASAAALRLAPLDEAALDLTARIHSAGGRGADAAACLDRLVDIRERQGRTEDACAAASRANDADPTDVRRDRVAALRAAVDTERARLADSGWAPEAADDPGAAAALAPTGPVATVAPVGPVAPVAPEAPLDPEAVVGPGAPGASGEPGAGAKPATQAPESVPVDPDALFVAAEDLAAGGMAQEAAHLYVLASTQYLEAGAADTAVDACLRALATAPAETDVHLALARIDLATGHDDRAAEKLDLLDRLLTLEGDEEGLAKVAAFRERTVSPDGSTRTHRHPRRTPGP